jgi:hypothetical protein
MAKKCPAETHLSSHEFGEVQAVHDGVHEPRKGPWYCEYPATTMHFQHTVVVQQVQPANEADPTVEPDPLWLVWSDDGRRSLRWQPACPTLLPSDEDPDGLFCVLPANHSGGCDSDQDNEYKPTADQRQKIADAYSRIQVILAARALSCPTLVIRDGEHEEADYARWSEMDHAVTCPPDAPCHQASALLDAGDEAGFHEFIARYRP